MSKLSLLLLPSLPLCRRCCPRGRVSDIALLLRHAIHAHALHPHAHARSKLFKACVAECHGLHGVPVLIRALTTPQRPHTAPRREVRLHITVRMPSSCLTLPACLMCWYMLFLGGVFSWPVPCSPLLDDFFSTIRE